MYIYIYIYSACIVHICISVDIIFSPLIYYYIIYVSHLRIRVLLITPFRRVNFYACQRVRDFIFSSVYSYYSEWFVKRNKTFNTVNVNAVGYVTPSYPFCFTFFIFIFRFISAEMFVQFVFSCHFTRSVLDLIFS